MGYVDKLNVSQKKVIELIVKKLTEQGITNKKVHAGVIAVASKETNLTPISEISYGGTSNARIRAVFGSKVNALSEAELTAIKSDDVRFWDQVYGYKDPTGESQKLGNTSPGDGLKYRGRGLNGITFKSIYARYNHYTEVDIVANPDALNELPVAVDILVGYFLETIPMVMKQHGMTNINDAKTVEQAVGVAYHANAGVGYSAHHVLNGPDPTGGGRARAFSRVQELHEYAKHIDPNSVEDVSVKGGGKAVEKPTYTPPPLSNGPIGGAVGAGGMNRPTDVKFIQNLLNEKAGAGLAVDGACGGLTIAAINRFQNAAFGWQDGKIDPDGTTLKKLIAAPKHNPVQQDQNTGKKEEKEEENTVEETVKIKSIPLDAKVHPSFH